jgi:DNA-binding response OmpR family regulator
MITARGEETDRVVGLELGADDYVCKPFSMRELMARVKAVLRRTQTSDMAPENPSILNGPQGLQMDTSSRTATLGGLPLNLTRLEFDLLHHLLVNAGQVLTRERLLEQAWGYDYAGDTRAVDSTIKRLRAKLRTYSREMTDLPDRDLIETVRGIGYRLERP